MAFKGYIIKRRVLPQTCGPVSDGEEENPGGAPSSLPGRRFSPNDQECAADVSFSEGEALTRVLALMSLLQAVTHTETYCECSEHSK